MMCVSCGSNNRNAAKCLIISTKACANNDEIRQQLYTGVKTKASAVVRIVEMPNLAKLW
jgi:hypothetical protein